MAATATEEALKSIYNYNMIFNNIGNTSAEDDLKFNTNLISDFDLQNFDPKRYEYYVNLLKVFNNDPETLRNLLNKYNSIKGLKVKERKIIREISDYVNKLKDIESNNPQQPQAGGKGSVGTSNSVGSVSGTNYQEGSVGSVSGTNYQEGGGSNNELLKIKRDAEELLGSAEELYRGANADASDASSDEEDDSDSDNVIFKDAIGTFKNAIDTFKAGLITEENGYNNSNTNGNTINTFKDAIGVFDTAIGKYKKIPNNQSGGLNLISMLRGTVPANKALKADAGTAATAATATIATGTAATTTLATGTPIALLQSLKSFATPLSMTPRKLLKEYEATPVKTQKKITEITGKPLTEVKALFASLANIKDGLINKADILVKKANIMVERALSADKDIRTRNKEGKDKFQKDLLKVLEDKRYKDIIIKERMKEQQTDAAAADKLRKKVAAEEAVVKREADKKKQREEKEAAKDAAKEAAKEAVQTVEEDDFIREQRQLPLEAQEERETREVPENLIIETPSSFGDLPIPEQQTEFTRRIQRPTQLLATPSSPTQELEKQTSREPQLYRRISHQPPSPTLATRQVPEPEPELAAPAPQETAAAPPANTDTVNKVSNQLLNFLESSIIGGSKQAGGAGEADGAGDDTLKARYLETRPQRYSKIRLDDDLIKQFRNANEANRSNGVGAIKTDNKIEQLSNDIDVYNALPSAMKNYNDTNKEIIQKIKRFEDDPKNPLEELELTFDDRIVFIIATFFIRYITIIMVQWCIDINIIKTFYEGFIYYAVIYIILFWFIVLFINIDNGFDVKYMNFNGFLNSVRTLFYYFYMGTNGVSRLLIHTSLIIILIVIPIILNIKKNTEFKPDGEQDGVKILDFEERKQLSKALSLFTMFIWLFTSIIATKF